MLYTRRRLSVLYASTLLFSASIVVWALKANNPSSGDLHTGQMAGLVAVLSQMFIITSVLFRNVKWDVLPFVVRSTGVAMTSVYCLSESFVVLAFDPYPIPWRIMKVTCFWMTLLGIICLDCLREQNRLLSTSISLAGTLVSVFLLLAALIVTEDFEIVAFGRVVTRRVTVSRAIFAHLTFVLGAATLARYQDVRCQQVFFSERSIARFEVSEAYAINKKKILRVLTTRAHAFSHA